MSTHTGSGTSDLHARRVVAGASGTGTGTEHTGTGTVRHGGSGTGTGTGSDTVEHVRQSAEEMAQKGQTMAREGYQQLCDTCGQSLQQVKRTFRKNPYLTTTLFFLAAFCLGMGSNAVWHKASGPSGGYYGHMDASSRAAHEALDTVLGKTYSAKAKLQGSSWLPRWLGGGSSMPDVDVSSSRGRWFGGGDSDVNLPSRGSSWSAGGAKDSSWTGGAKDWIEGLSHKRTAAEQMGLKDEGVVKSSLHAAENRLAQILYAAGDRVRAD